MSVKKNISLSYVFQILNTALGFVASVFVTRLLGTEGRGDYSLFVNALALISIWLGFSLPSSVIYYVASKKYSLDKVFNTMLLITLGTTALVWLALQLILHIGLGWMVLPARYSGTEWQMVFLGQFFLTQLNNIIIAFLNGKKIFIAPFKINVIATFSSIVIWVLIYLHVVRLSFQPFGIVVLIGTGILVLQVLLNGWTLMRNEFRLSGRSLEWKELRVVFKFASMIYVCNSIQFLSYRMDLWFVDYYQGKAHTGVYSLAATLAQLVWILPSSIASVLYTYMSGSTPEDALEFLKRYMRISFYATLVISVGAFVFFYFAVPVIYGRDFAPSTIMIGILLLGIVPFSIPILTGNFFAGVQKVKYNLFATSIGFGVCLLLDILLIPRYGAIGACFATVFSYLSNTIYCLYIVRTVFKTRVNLSPVVLLRQDIRPIWLIVRNKLGLSPQMTNISEP